MRAKADTPNRRQPPRRAAHPVAQLDRRYVWHPFTQMKDWLAREPIVIVSGRGAVLRDIQGREYLDANASIWTNLHGHRHPRLDGAVRRQLGRLAHCSALGLANEPASKLAERLVRAAAETGPGTREAVFPAAPRAGAKPEPPHPPPVHAAAPDPALTKVFFSDDGSTAIEVALKLAYEFARRSGRSRAPRFLSLEGAYHGDTVGAVSLGHIDLFHRAYAGLLFKSDTVMAPYCYRCPFNRARPERVDARGWRRCAFECVDQVERRLDRCRRRGEPYAAWVVEPLIQGAAGMIPQPEGWLRAVTDLVRAHGTLIIADEVMTGFGRTGATLFACQREGVRPDFLALAKGLTGGYLPMAATLTTQPVFDAFLGDYAEFKTFFHGHSYTANPLGAAVAFENLKLLESEGSRQARVRLEAAMRGALATLWSLPNVGDVRQVGLIAGVELVRDWRSRQPFELAERVGIRVTEAMARRGVLTRPIGNVVVLMPPYCTTPAQVDRMVEALWEAVAEVCGRAARGVRKRPKDAR